MNGRLRGVPNHNPPGELAAFCLSLLYLICYGPPFCLDLLSPVATRLLFKGIEKVAAFHISISELWLARGVDRTFGRLSQGLLRCGRSPACLNLVISSGKRGSLPRRSGFKVPPFAPFRAYRRSIGTTFGLLFAQARPSSTCRSLQTGVCK